MISHVLILVTKPNTRISIQYNAKMVRSDERSIKVQGTNHSDFFRLLGENDSSLPCRLWSYCLISAPSDYIIKFPFLGGILRLMNRTSDFRDKKIPVLAQHFSTQPISSKKSWLPTQGKCKKLVKSILTANGHHGMCPSFFRATLA